MKKLSTFVLLAVTLLLLAPMSVLAGTQQVLGDRPPLETEDAGEMMPGDQPGGRQFERLADLLDLSEAQQEQVKALRDAEREAVKPLLQQLQENREAIHQLTQATTFDEAAVRRLATKQAAINTELLVSRARTRSQINALLTPEQRSLADKLGPRMGKHEERRERRGR